MTRDTLEAPTRSSFAPPREGAGEARLELRRGGPRLAVRAAAMDALCRVAFDGVVPEVRAEGGRVAIDYPRFTLASFLPGSVEQGDVELNDAVAWSLLFAGGLRDATLDLGDLDLVRLEIAGGAREVSLTLPEPRGAVAVRVTGGASKVTLVRPAGSAAILEVAGGVSRLAFDEERYGALAGELRLGTPGAGFARDRYEIEILGGASRVVVTALDGGEW